MAYGYSLSISTSESSPNNNNNTTQIKVTVKANRAGTGAFGFNATTLKVTLEGEGTKNITVDSYDFRNASTITLGTVTFTVHHDDDGGGKRTVSASWASGNSYINGGSALTASKEITLQTIPRASDFSLSGSQLGSAVTVTIDRKSASFTHLVEYKFEDSSWATAASAAGASCSFTPSLSLGSQIPNTLSGILTVRVTTKNGSSTVGSAVEHTVTLSLPASVVPSAPSITLERQDNGVPSGWGVYVQNYTKVKISAASNGSYGSTIKSYSINCDGLNGSNGTVFGPFSSPGKKTVKVTVTDSRGRTNESTQEFTVYEYYNPSISIVSAARCDSTGTVTTSGTYLKITINFSYASVNGKNTVSRNANCNGVIDTSFASGTSFVLACNIATTSSYVLTASIEDALGNDRSVSVVIPTDVVLEHVKLNGLGIAFGGYSTKDNAVQFYWAIFDKNQEELDSKSIPRVLSVTDSYVEIGNYDEWVERGKPYAL